jgi:hypothetical protein
MAMAQGDRPGVGCRSAYKQGPLACSGRAAVQLCPVACAVLLASKDTHVCAVACQTRTHENK